MEAAAIKKQPSNISRKFKTKQNASKGKFVNFKKEQRGVTNQQPNNHRPVKNVHRAYTERTPTHNQRTSSVHHYSRQQRVIK